MHPFCENPKRLKQYGAISLRRRGGDGALEAIPVNAILNAVGSSERAGHPSTGDTSHEISETMVALAPFEAVAGCALR